MSSLSIFGGEVVRFPPEVIAGDHAERLVAEARGRIDPALLAARSGGRGALTTSSAARIERLVQSARRVVQPALPVFPGVRGALALRTKRILIRILYWYVEPRWDAQSTFNRECSESTKALGDELELMKADLRRIQLMNRALRQELQTLRSEAAEPPSVLNATGS